jgi:hypothetical protein
MNKIYVFAAMAVMCLFVTDRAALAQDPPLLIVSVPFEFVVAARTMPAGSYRVSRISFDAHSGLVISGQGGSALVLPVAVDDGSAAQSGSLDFERIGDKYLLAKVETLDHAYAVAVPHATTMLVQVKDHINAAFASAK